MANRIEFKIDNAEVRKLTRKLQLLGPRLEARAVKNATSKAMQPVAVEARRNARKTKRTGWLSKNIGKVTRQYRKGVTMTIVGPANNRDPRTGENPANIGHLIENPVRPHPINHPGFEGRPFIRPAFDTKSSQAEKIYADELTKALIKEAISI